MEAAMKNNGFPNLTVFFAENLLLYHKRRFEPLKTRGGLFQVGNNALRCYYKY